MQGNITAKPLTLESLHLVDRGLIAVMVDREIQRCFSDCDDRPTLEKPREVIIKIKQVPAASDERLNHVKVAVSVESKIPGRNTVEYPMLATSDGLMFQPESPRNPRQNTLYANSQEGKP